MADNTIARITVFKPGASPPTVLMTIFFIIMWISGYEVLEESFEMFYYKEAFSIGMME
jgi:hypothetical protein